MNLQDLLNRLLTPQQLAAYLDTENQPTLPLLDKLYPMSSRRYHDSIKVALESKIRITGNIPHTVRGGQFWTLKNQDKNLTDFVVPPVRIADSISETEISDLEEAMRSHPDGGQFALQMFLAERMEDRATTYMKTAEAMVADWIRGVGTMYFPIFIDPLGTVSTKEQDYPLASKWMTKTATLKWDNASADVATIYGDLYQWSVDMGNDNGQGGSKMILCPGDVFAVILAKAQESQTTATFTVQIGQGFVQLGEFRIEPVNGSYTSYPNSSATLTLLEAKKIQMVSMDYRRELLFCKTDLRDADGNAMSYQNQGMVQAPIAAKAYWNNDGESLEIKTESKPLPVDNPAAWLTATVLA